MSRDNRLWDAPRLHGELAKLGITVSRTSVAKYMVRRSYPPSPTWRTFIRNQAPDLVVTEVYAELSSQFRAVSIQVVRAVQRWLRGLVSGWVCQFQCQHAKPVTEQNELVSLPIARALGSADLVMVSERSPPELRWSSTNQPFHASPPIEMGKADVRLDSSVKNGLAVSPKLLLNPQVDNKEQSTDVSQKAAA